MKILLVGYGKMGKAIESIALENGHVVCDIAKNSHELNEILKKGTEAEVAVEFSSPESGFDNIAACILQGLPVVSGTTGWLERMTELEKLVESKNGTFLYAPNFSIGMNIVFELAKKLGKGYANFSDFKVSISEVHHPQKKDSPSGTAIKLANEFLNENTILREWGAEEKKDDILPIEARREEGVVGTHSLSFENDMESFRIEHVAKDRKVFALGAVRAAEFLQGKKGCFSMNDLLGF